MHAVHVRGRKYSGASWMERSSRVTGNIHHADQVNPIILLATAHLADAAAAFIAAAQKASLPGMGERPARGVDRAPRHGGSIQTP